MRLLTCHEGGPVDNGIIDVIFDFEDFRFVDKGALLNAVLVRCPTTQLGPVSLQRAWPLSAVPGFS